MNESLVAFRSELTENMLDFIWRQWSQLGAAGSSRGFPENWVIDPEALLAFSAEIARHDARVFDEIMDWMKRNGHRINTQRLSKIISFDHIGDPAVIGAIADWMKKNDKDIKWTGIAARKQPSAKQPPEPLFHSQSTIPVAEMDRDHHFSKYGLIRPPVELRGLSQPVNMRQTPNAVFTFRALFGIGIRADVSLYMINAESGHARFIANFLGYNHMRVQEVLNELAACGMLTVHASGRIKDFLIDRSRWWPVIMKDAPIPIWRNWRAFYRGMTIVLRKLWAIDADRADDYIVFSIMREALEEARGHLYDFDPHPDMMASVEQFDWSTLNRCMHSILFRAGLAASPGGPG